MIVTCIHIVVNIDKMTIYIYITYDFKIYVNSRHNNMERCDVQAVDQEQSRR